MWRLRIHTSALWGLVLWSQWLWSLLDQKLGHRTVSSPGSLLETVCKSPKLHPCKGKALQVCNEPTRADFTEGRMQASHCVPNQCSHLPSLKTERYFLLATVDLLSSTETEKSWHMGSNNHKAVTFDIETFQTILHQHTKHLLVSVTCSSTNSHHQVLYLNS